MFSMKTFSNFDGILPFLIEFRFTFTLRSNKVVVTLLCLACVHFLKLVINCDFFVVISVVTPGGLRRSGYTGHGVLLGLLRLGLLRTNGGVPIQWGLYPNG